MVAKTDKGKFNKERFGDGRISEDKEFERQTGRRKELPSRIKKNKKQLEKLKNVHKLP